MQALSASGEEIQAGEDYVRSAYGKEEECRNILLKNIASRFPDAPENAVRKLVIK